MKSVARYRQTQGSRESCCEVKPRDAMLVIWEIARCLRRRIALMSIANRPLAYPALLSRQLIERQ